MSELIGIAHLSKSERLGIPPLLVSFFYSQYKRSQIARRKTMDHGQKTNGHKSQDARNL